MKSCSISRQENWILIFFCQFSDKELTLIHLLRLWGQLQSPQESPSSHLLIYPPLHHPIHHCLLFEALKKFDAAILTKLIHLQAFTPAGSDRIFLFASPYFWHHLRCHYLRLGQWFLVDHSLLMDYLGLITRILAIIAVSIVIFAYFVFTANEHGATCSRSFTIIYWADSRSVNHWGDDFGFALR